MALLTFKVSKSMDKQQELRKIAKSAILAYLGGVGMVLFAFTISVYHGKGWKPLLVLLPLYIIVFGGIIYQVIKDIRALRQVEPQKRE
jgi:hypothetical protein